MLSGLKCSAVADTDGFDLRRVGVRERSGMDVGTPETRACGIRRIVLATASHHSMRARGGRAARAARWAQLDSAFQPRGARSVPVHSRPFDYRRCTLLAGPRDCSGVGWSSRHRGRSRVSPDAGGSHSASRTAGAWPHVFVWHVFACSCAGGGLRLSGPSRKCPLSGLDLDRCAKALRACCAKTEVRATRLHSDDIVELLACAPHSMEHPAKRCLPPPGR